MDFLLLNSDRSNKSDLLADNGSKRLKFEVETARLYYEQHDYTAGDNEEIDGPARNRVEGMTCYDEGRQNDERSV